MLTRDDGTDLTQFTWHGWNCIKEVTGESETVYHIPEGQILSFIRDGERYELHADALGSTRMITDSEGEVVARYEHSAFGSAISVTEDSALAGFPMRFVGSLGVRFDALSGMHYMRNRWYSPLQRFISRDPIGISGGRNLYVYCDNDPMRYADPTGLIAESKNVTCAQLKEALASTKGRVPGWVLGMLAGEGNNPDGFWHRAGKQLEWWNGMDIGVPPTRARPSNEAYLQGYIPDPMPGAGPNFWELSRDQRSTALAILNEKHPEITGPIYAKVATVDGNLHTAVNSLDRIGKAMYGSQYPQLTDEQWIDVIVQHDQGGPFPPRGYNGKDSDKLKLRGELIKSYNNGYKAYFDQFCPCK